jgi:hypothetical protein
LDDTAKDDEPVFQSLVPIVAVPDGRLWMVSYDQNGHRLAIQSKQIASPASSGTATKSTENEDDED